MQDGTRTTGASTLWLGPHTRSRHQVSLEFGLDDLRFTASYWYGDVDLLELEERFGKEVMDRIWFHVAAFTANTLVSLRPTHFDPGPYGRFCTAEFWNLWRRIIQGVWAQWRFEHDLPDYPGPDLLGGPPASTGSAWTPAVSAARHDGPQRASVLAFFGGGKDSVVSLRLLQDAGLTCDTLVYSSSVYGNADRQHQLCDRLLDALGSPAETRRRIWSYDDVLDSPVTRLLPELGASALTAAETPASVFVALPLVLAHGYTRLCLGHERSADRGNLTWARTGEEVNHQWGKSAACEELLAGYLRTHLIEDCDYFSPLKPVHDPLIFTMLADEPAAVPLTHSCNVAKPWCGRCAKCAYVWLGYHAYLSPRVVAQTFPHHGNLLDHPENQQWFRQLLGLAEHTPFECVGGVEEVRLAFELCRRRGLVGAAMRMFEREVPAVAVGPLLDRYLAVGPLGAWVPEALGGDLRKRLLQASARAHHALAAEPVGLGQGTSGAAGRLARPTS